MCNSVLYVCEAELIGNCKEPFESYGALFSVVNAFHVTVVVEYVEERL